MSALFKQTGYPGIMKNMQVSSGSTIAYIFLYILVAIIIVVIILMLLGIKIDYKWFDFRSPYTKIMSRSYLFWPLSTQFTNLSTVPDSIPGFIDNSYTMIIDCIIYNSRSYSALWKGEGPYRHLYHRGSDDLHSNTIGNLLLGGCSASSGGSNSNIPSNGLPKRMNPGVFIDPNLNDIIVFVDTDHSSRESVRIVDIPLDIPFRIAIVVNKLVLEVYLNCKLEVTKILKSLPKPVENRWFGLSGSAAAQAQIKDMHIWTSPLASSEINPLCPPIDFTAKRPICEGADTAVKVDKTDKTAKPDINLGFDKALSKCNSPK